MIFSMLEQLLLLLQLQLHLLLLHLLRLRCFLYLFRQLRLYLLMQQAAVEKFAEGKEEEFLVLRVLCVR